MRSSNRSYMASVDQLRAYAVLLVLFFHGTQIFGVMFAQGRPFAFGRDWLYSSNPLSTIVFEGHTGVSLFMVLSGFIFTVGTLGHEVSYPRFLGNRLLRIYPLFVLIVLLAAAANPGAFTMAAFLQTMLGFGNMTGGLVLGDISSGALWAVAVEMQFYLLFPLLIKILTRFGIGTFVRLFAALIVVRGLVYVVTKAPDTAYMASFSIAGRLDQFLLGMIAAWLYVRHRKRFRGMWKLTLCALAAVAMLWVFNQLHGYFAPNWWRLAWVDVEGGVWALVVLTYTATVRTQNLFSRSLTKLGELSYSMYLLHLPVMGLLMDRHWWINLPGLSPMTNALLSVLLLAVPLVIAVSLVTYRGVEQPFLQLRMKYLISSPTQMTDPVRADRPERKLDAAGIVG